MDQTVNLTSSTSVVRIHLFPPQTGTRSGACLRMCCTMKILSVFNGDVRPVRGTGGRAPYGIVVRNFTCASADGAGE